MADEEKANYTKPTSQVDLEERLARGNESSRVLVTSDEYARRLEERDDEEKEAQRGRSFAVEDNDLDNYVATDPVYQTYANETEKPLRAEDGPEAELEKRMEQQQQPPVAEPDEEEGARRTTDSEGSTEETGESESGGSTRQSSGGYSSDS